MSGGSARCRKPPSMPRRQPSQRPSSLATGPPWPSRSAGCGRPFPATRASPTSTLAIAWISAPPSPPWTIAPPSSSTLRYQRPTSGPSLWAMGSRWKAGPPGPCARKAPSSTSGLGSIRSPGPFWPERRWPTGTMRCARA